MKKTLIALLALGGLAMAEETEPTTIEIYASTGTEFNADWSTTLKDSGWVQGDEYILSLAVVDGLNDGQFMKLADNCWLVSQTTGGPYVGVNTVGSNQVSKSDWTFSVDSSSYMPVRMLTAGEEALAGWAQNEGGTGSQARDMGGALFVEVIYRKDAGTSVMYTYYGESFGDEFVMPTGTDFDLEKFAMRDAVGLGGYGTLTVYKNVPEPTTGTLSLLALVGLCIRRRK